jgi:hypothetical protein
VLVLSILAASANAQTSRRTGNRQALEKAAKKACITGDYRKGVDILGELFVEFADQVYVYNQARCFEQNHLWQEALDHFREYERKAPIAQGHVTEELHKHMAECAARLEEERATARRPAPEPAGPAPVPPPVEAKPAEGALAVFQPSGPQEPAPMALGVRAPATEANAGGALRLAGIVVGSVGLAALAAGISLNLKSNSITNEMYPPARYDADKDASRRSYKTLALVSYGVGAAAIMAGATLYIIGWTAKRQSRSTQVSFVPFPVTGGICATLQGVY